MNLDISAWKKFRFGDLIDDIYKAKANAKIDLTTSSNKSDGYIPFISRTESNNNVDCYVLESEIANIEDGNAITVGDTTSTISYQPQSFATGDHIIVIRSEWLNEYTGLFIVSLLMKERFRYSYGRAYLMNSLKETEFLLPVLDEDKPDWTWIETYIKTLKYKRISTKKKKEYVKAFDTSEWKEFYLHEILNVKMGNGIDAILTTSDEPKYNYVSRDSNGNGVVDYVDAIEGVSPFPAGAMSLALGGSYLGSCFIQKKPFYTAQNVAVLSEKEPLSIYTKLFLAAIIRNECKIKYQAFGRELNSHIKKDFTIKLPVKKDSKGNSNLNKENKYSRLGYVPDWIWMENYIKSLPYSDKIV